VSGERACEKTIEWERSEKQLDHGVRTKRWMD